MSASKSEGSLPGRPQLSAEDIQPPDPIVDTSSDALVNRERQDYKLADGEAAVALLKHTLKAKEARLDIEIKNHEANRDLREKLTKRVITLTTYWLASIFTTLLLKGFGTAFGFFDLSDGVIIAQLGATGLLGLLAIILRSLFSPENNRRSARRNRDEDTKGRSL